MRRLAAGDRALDRGIRFRRRQQHLPEVFGCKLPRHALRASARARKSGSVSPRSCELPQNVARAHRRVLHVRSGFAFEAERLLKIERDHRIARELQQEVAQRADGDLRRHRAPFAPRARPACRDATSSSAFSISLSIRSSAFTPEAFAAGDFDVRPLACLLRRARCPARRSSAARAPPSRRRSGCERSACSSIPERAQAGHHHVLQIGLARIDHVVDARAVAELPARLGCGSIGR